MARARKREQHAVPLDHRQHPLALPEQQRVPVDVVRGRHRRRHRHARVAALRPRTLVRGDQHAMVLAHRFAFRFRQPKREVAGGGYGIEHRTRQFVDIAT